MILSRIPMAKETQKMNGNLQRNKNNNGKRSNAVRSHLSLGSDSSAFKGANPEAGVVLGLSIRGIQT